MRSEDLMGARLAEGDMVLSIPRNHESPLIIGVAVRPFPDSRWKGPWMVEPLWNDTYRPVRRRLLANRFFILRKADDSVPDTLLGRLRVLGFTGEQ